MVVLDDYDDGDDSQYHKNYYFMSMLIHLRYMLVNIRVDHLIAMSFPTICAILQWRYMNVKAFWITHNSTAYLSICKVINYWSIGEGCPEVTGGQ